MSFFLSGLGLASVLYAIYQFTRKGTTATPPLFRDPFHKPDTFQQDTVLSQAPKSQIPLPVRQVQPPPPSLLSSDFVFPEELTSVD